MAAPAQMNDATQSVMFRQSSESDQQPKAARIGPTETQLEFDRYEVTEATALDQLPEALEKYVGKAIARADLSTHRKGIVNFAFWMFDVPDKGRLDIFADEGRLQFIYDEGERITTCDLDACGAPVKPLLYQLNRQTQQSREEECESIPEAARLFSTWVST